METNAMTVTIDDAADRPTPAAAALLQMLGGSAAASLLYVAAELGLPDLVAAGQGTAAVLLARTGSDADALERLLRGLVVLGVFVPFGGERLALTPLGDLLRSDAPGSLRATARLMGNPVTQLAWAAL